MLRLTQRFKDSIEIGDKVQFKEEKGPYIVRGRTKRYMILTRPYYAKKTIIYAIVDWATDKRSSDSHVFSPYNYEEPEGILECLQSLTMGVCRLSRRNQIPVKIAVVKRPTLKHRHKLLKREV